LFPRYDYETQFSQGADPRFLPETLGIANASYWQEYHGENDGDKRPIDSVRATSAEKRTNTT